MNMLPRLPAARPLRAAMYGLRSFECESRVLTALTCFSIEWRYLSDRSLAQDAFMNRHRLCAKGNATTFPLQWEDLLSELERLNPTAGAAATCRLPHVGDELRDKIAVLIKVGNKQEGATVPQRIIHQAVVRRHVVVGLIAAMVVTRPPGIQRCRHGCRDTTGRAVARRRCTGRNCRLVRE